jgi:hypothetical protein
MSLPIYFKTVLASNKITLSKFPLLLAGKVTSSTKASPFQRKMVSKLPQGSSFQKKTIIILSST